MLWKSRCAGAPSYALIKLRSKLYLHTHIVPMLSVMSSAQLTPTAPGVRAPARSPATLNSLPRSYAAARCYRKRSILSRCRCITPASHQYRLISAPQSPLDPIVALKPQCEWSTTSSAQPPLHRCRPQRWQLHVLPPYSRMPAPERVSPPPWALGALRRGPTPPGPSLCTLVSYAQHSSLPYRPGDSRPWSRAARSRTTAATSVHQHLLE